MHDGNLCITLFLDYKLSLKPLALHKIKKFFFFFSANFYHCQQTIIAASSQIQFTT